MAPDHVEARNTSTARWLQQWYDAHPPILACEAEDLQEMKRWQGTAREKLRALLRLDPVDEPACSIEVDTLERVDRTTHTAEKLMVRVEPEMWVPAWLLTPRNHRPPFRLLLCLRREIHEQVHCPCSYVPDLFRFFDWPDIACLIAPRPLLIQSGTEDYIPMPLVRAAADRIRSVYELHQAAHAMDADSFAGGHVFGFPPALFDAVADTNLLTLVDLELGHWSDHMLDIDWDGLDWLLSRYRELPMVLLRVGMAVDPVLFGHLDRHENLYLETSYYVGAGSLERLCDRFGPRRALFGTAGPIHNPGPAISLLTYSGLDAEARRLIAGDNLRRLLGCTPRRAIPTCPAPDCSR